MKRIAAALSNSQVYWGCGFAVAAGALALSVPAVAQPLGSKIANDMSQCSNGEGPAVLVNLSGLRSSEGNLFVRTYHARKGDWLKSRRYISRVDTVPRSGSMSVCVPVPAEGDYAVAVQHDINGNRKKDFSVDGAGMSNNPEIKTFLGIPRPPSLSKTRFSAGSGVTRVAIQVRYRN